MTTGALKVLIMAAEMVPFAKTGGLADVTGALPKALRAQGHDVRVAMPRYGRIDPARFELQSAGEPYTVTIDEQAIDAQLMLAQAGDVPVYMVENARYFERDGIYMYEDDADRFIFCCRAALEGVKRLGWQPDVIHCHDWHTAIVPNWLKTIYRHDPFFANTACIYTIHNLAYQGIFGYRVLEVAGVDEYGFLAHPDTPHLNDVVDFMGRGIYYADIVNTVSETYAREIRTPEFGEGLDPLLRDRADRLYGVLNGIDTTINDPAGDAYLAAHYDTRNLDGKRACKHDLQITAGLPERPETPLIGVISRLTMQKGFDLIEQALEPLLRTADMQLVVLGTGDQHFHDWLSELRARFPQQLAAFLTFKAELAQKIYAGSDLFLMPSRSEPCGLGQMIALRYGSIPLVRATGGLADTIADCDAQPHTGNGFTFADYTPATLEATLLRALARYRRPAEWRELMLRAMQADNSWASSARRYAELYRRAIALRQAERTGPA